VSARVCCADLETALNFQEDFLPIDEFEDSEWLWRTSCKIVDMPNSGELFSAEGMSAVQPRA
jgi:hypothetical protein